MISRTQMWDGCDWNLSIDNTPETAWGRALWMVVTAVAIPKTKTKGSSSRYWLWKKTEISTYAVLILQVLLWKMNHLTSISVLHAIQIYADIIHLVCLFSGRGDIVSKLHIKLQVHWFCQAASQKKEYFTCLFRSRTQNKHKNTVKHKIIEC